MIIVHYGTHEAVHGTLFPSNHKRHLLNSISGFIGFSIFGQNYIFMRWSHMAHHRFGRTDSTYTIDGKNARSNIIDLVWYYSSLLGASCLYHEIAGYLYPLLGDKYHILTRRFKKCYYYNLKYLTFQTGVFLVTILLIYVGGYKFLICRLAFMIYWGIFQNVAHYGLEIGDYKHAHLAARTYRLPSIVEFLMFRGGAYHLEHHAFPFVPGPHLNSKEVQIKLREKLGFIPVPKVGFFVYVFDCLKQFGGPSPKQVEQFGYKK